MPMKDANLGASSLVLSIGEATGEAMVEMVPLGVAGARVFGWKGLAENEEAGWMGGQMGRELDDARHGRGERAWLDYVGWRVPSDDVASQAPLSIGCRLP